jgi:type IV pilus assembly protein PilB
VIKKSERTFGELLLEEGFITQEALDEALGEHSQNGRRIAEILIERNHVQAEHVAMCLGKQHGIPYLPLSDFEIDPEIVRLISEDMARKYQMVPVDRTDNSLTVALADPANVFLLDNVRRSLGMEIIPLICTTADIDNAINRYYVSAGEVLQQMIQDMETGDEGPIVKEEEQNLEDVDPELNAPVIRLVNLIINEAIRTGASDVHFEPEEKDYRLRYRIDGVLKERTPPPKKLQNAITSRLKIMSDLDISEKRRPQDGRFKVRAGKRVVDFRVSALPTVHGEKVVLRLLDKSNLNLDLKVLGFEPEQLALFEKAIRRPYGQVLVTGPTGSGKSTTLYSALTTINDPEINIITVEDPVEYQIKGINQVQARPGIGLTFAAALRSILRQDPDVVMIGEIRDLETAEIAVKAALTGHLVFSTLHTNDAPSTITRLIDMGVENFLVAASLVLVVAQRLVRKLCPRCKELYEPSEMEMLELGIDPSEKRGVQFAKAVGCSSCNDTGYKGRIAVYEVMGVTEELIGAIMHGKTTRDLQKIAVEQGMLTLRDSGVRKVLGHTTTASEVIKVSYDN